MKRKLLFAAALLVGALGFNANAQEVDVTDKYLVNPNFEASTIFDGTSLGEKGKSNAAPVSDAKNPVQGAMNLFEIEGWKNMDIGRSDVSDYQRVFTLPYGPTINIQADKKLGEQAVTAPAKPSGTEENNNLLFVQASWSPGHILGIKQDVTLPNGVYKLTFDTYVQQNVLQNAASLCGVKIGGNATYAWAKDVNKWVNNEVYFIVEEDETPVEISMGYVSARSVGAGSSAFLFVDNVKLYLVNETAPNVENISATDQIINPNATEKTSDNKIIAPWVSSGTNNTESNKINTGNGFDGKSGFFEPSAWGKDNWDATLSQELKGLPSGLYTLQAAVQSATDVVTILTAGTTSGTSHSAVLPANGTVNGTIATDGSVVQAGGGVAGWNYGTVTAYVTDGTLKIGVYSAASAAQKWTNIDNFTLSYIPASTLFPIDAYIETLNTLQTEAEQLLANDEYKNVTGEEKTNLETAKNATPETETADGYQALIDELQIALNAFKNAKEAYDAFVAAKAQAVYYEYNLPYADEAKKDAVITALDEEATSAAEATTYTNTIILGYRAYVESNALAEGVDGAVDYTSKIENANAQQGDQNAATPGQAWGWTKDPQLGRQNNQPLTDSEGKHGSNQNYFDSNHWNDASWTADIKQQVNLPAGKYILTVSARSSDKLVSFDLIGGDQTAPIKMSGNSGGTFGNGWEDNYVVFYNPVDGNVTIGIEAESETVNTWLSFDRFRLVRIGEATVSAKVSEAGFATYVTPTAVDFGECPAYIVTEVDNGYAMLKQVEEAPKGTPVILEGVAGTEKVYDFTAVANAAIVDGNELQVSNGEVTVTDKIYVLANVNDTPGFYVVDDTKYNKLPAGQVYLEDPAAGVKFIGFNKSGDATGIKNVEAVETENAVIYNLSGQRVANPTKGIYIVNGKKVLVK